jgi:hypothetical protein
MQPHSESAGERAQGRNSIRACVAHLHRLARQGSCGVVCRAVPCCAVLCCAVRGCGVRMCSARWFVTCWATPARCRRGTAPELPSPPCLRLLGPTTPAILGG